MAKKTVPTVFETPQELWPKQPIPRLIAIQIIEFEAWNILMWTIPLTVVAATLPHITFVLWHYLPIWSAQCNGCPQCNQICMETIGSPGRLVGALAAPGKSLDKGAARGKSAPPVPSPLPGSLPTSIDLSPYVFLDASLGACLGRARLLRQARTNSHQNFW